MIHPDHHEALIGFRAFRITRDGALWPLADTGAPPWRPGPNRAVHAIPGPVRDAPLAPAPHDAPARGCACGINAFNDPLHHHLCELDLVLGAVACWGTIDLYPDGLRASNAMLVAIARPLPGSCLEPSWVEAAAERYDVPLVAERDLPWEAQRHGIVPSFDFDRWPWNHTPGARFAVFHRGRAPRYHLRLDELDDSLHLRPDQLMTEALGGVADVRFLIAPDSDVRSGQWLAILEGHADRLAICAPADGHVRAINRRLIHDPSADDWFFEFTPWYDDLPAVWGSAADRVLHEMIMVAASGIDVLADLRPANAGLPNADADWWKRLPEYRLHHRRSQFASVVEARHELCAPLARALRTPETQRLAQLDARVVIDLIDPDFSLAVVSDRDGWRVVLDSITVADLTPSVRLTIDATLAFGLLTKPVRGFASRWLSESDVEGDLDAASNFLTELAKLLPLALARGHRGQLQLSLP